MSVVTQNHPRQENEIALGRQYPRFHNVARGLRAGTSASRKLHQWWAPCLPEIHWIPVGYLNETLLMRQLKVDCYKSKDHRRFANSCFAYRENVSNLSKQSKCSRYEQRMVSAAERTSPWWKVAKCIPRRTSLT